MTTEHTPTFVLTSFDLRDETSKCIWDEQGTYTPPQNTGINIEISFAKQGAFCEERYRDISVISIAV